MVMIPAETILMAAAEAKDRAANGLESGLIEKFDAAVKTVRLHDGPRPLGKSEDWLRGQQIGDRAGFEDRSINPGNYVNRKLSSHPLGS